MNLEKTLKSIQADLDCNEGFWNLRRAARDVGHELPRERLDVLREFRSQVACLQYKGNIWTQGYLQGLLDVVAAYDAAVEPRITSIDEELFMNNWLAEQIKCVSR